MLDRIADGFWPKCSLRWMSYQLPRGAAMPARDGYIAGVPCWVDTSQPDPDAAVAFYSGLFGWEFEEVMPPESPCRYFVARLAGGGPAAGSSLPDGAGP